MNTQIEAQAFSGHSSSFRGCDAPYEPSIASSASSSQSSISVFSDADSTQSSIASSISDDFRYNYEQARDTDLAQAQVRRQLPYDSYKKIAEQSRNASLLQSSTVPSYADVTSVPKEHRQHPRRNSLAKTQKPPTLQRQADRKFNFVESLVDSATQMVEVIWPLSVVPCKSDGRSGKGVLPLRTYIEETLRRSRTSYSTLQVALYYLILIKPFIPKNDFTQEQKADCPASRALMCGRRMFLAALILASKYLQDRNYSAKAWSKMSGLKSVEINENERSFLDKVDWKLHIPDPIFKKWTEVVLKYAPNQTPPSPDQSLSIPATWKGIIPLLTPDLDTIPIPESRLSPYDCNANYGITTPITPAPTKNGLSVMQLDSTSHETTPTPMTVLPRFLEPKPDLAPPTPALARMGPLPTPQLTPSSVASSTPAVSACSSRRPSIASAMAMAQNANFNRCAMDTFPMGAPGRECYPFASRRPSVASVASSRSSPESMISDRSRSSRASSISSVSTVSTVSSTSSLAPNRACLARQATCRNAGLPIPFATLAEEKDGTATKPIIIADDAEMVSSPDFADFTISDKKLHTVDRHSKFAPHPPSTSCVEKSRKRGRCGGNRRSDLQEEVRLMLEEAEDLMEIDDEQDIVDLTSPSPAADYATKMLARSNPAVYSKEIQPPASISRRGSGRMPVQKQEGSKRTCCTTGAMSISPAPLYGEVA